MNRYLKPFGRQKCHVAVFSIAAWTLFLFAAGDVLAQRGTAARRGKKPKAERVSIAGTLHAMIPKKSAIQIVTDEGQRWQVQLTDTTDVHVDGEGGPELLRPGLFVRFYSKLTRTGKGVEPVKELKVVTPDASFRPGIFQDDEDVDEDLEKDRSEEKRSPGEDSEDETANPSGDDDDPELAGSTSDGTGPDSTGPDSTGPDNSKPDNSKPEIDKPESRRSAARSRSHNKKPRIIAARRYWISGQLRSMKKGRLVVSSGEKSVRVEVDETTRVVVEATDLRLARAGDSVRIRGSYYPDRPGYAKAYDVKVTIAANDPSKDEKKSDRRKKRDSKMNRSRRESKTIDGKKTDETPGDAEEKGESF